MKETFVVFDFETTGLDPYTDKIIEVGLVRLEQGEITGQYHTLVNPGVPLPLKIKRLTGLDEQDLANAPVIGQVLPEIMGFIGDSAVAGHNVQFDLGFLEAARGQPFSGSFYDTLELARLVVPGAANYRLDSLCASFKVEASAWHRALDDAMATARLLAALLQKLRETEPGLLLKLAGLLHLARSGWHMFLAELVKDVYRAFPSRKIPEVPYWKREEPAEERNAGPSRAGTPAREKVPLPEEEAAALLGRQGPLAKTLPNFEYRPQQEAMVRQVARALNDEKYLLMEAGTGVGKSMAYLVPAVLWSLLNKERVLVSTHTINLQEQLWLKDVPLLAGVIGKPFRAALAKGRQNYLCLRRWFGALDSVSQPEEAAFLARMLTWLSETGTGDRGELNLSPGENDFWLNICGEAEGCLGSRCRYQKSCFVNRARRSAEEADLIISNHSLLFADVRAENRVLPSYGPLIIDEAHHLEESATAHLGRQLTQGALNRWLGSTGRLLARLAETAPPGDGTRWTRSLEAAQAARLEAAEAARLFFQLAWAMAEENQSGGAGEYSRTSLRLPCRGSNYGLFLAAGEKFLEILDGLLKEFKSCTDLMELWSIAEENWAGPARDLSLAAQAGLALCEDFRFILESSDRGFVYWAEFELSGRNSMVRHVSLQAAPIDVGDLLYESFFKHKNTAVMASATLSVNGAFDHFIERTGLYKLGEERLVRVHFDSPFAYERQALLCISRGLPVQGAVPEDVYMEETADTIYRLVEVTGGRTLVLFTSHRTLREVYKRLKARFEALDICLLGHGIDGSRSRLLDEFKTAGRTVLFGSSSFWEGVDVPGEALSLVVMVKLPFSSPSAPVMEARLEALARQERDGFRSLSVPHAVIRFKQGFGRLIRTSSDRGCVVVLDGRILSKSYGRQFLNSLPLKNHFRGGVELVAKRLSAWLENDLGDERAVPGNTW